MAENDYATHTKDMKPYLRKIVLGRSIPGIEEPSERDVQIMRLALDGRTEAAITADLGIDFGELVAGLKRTRDAIRSGTPPRVIEQEHAEFVEWQQRSYAARPRLVSMRSESAPAGKSITRDAQSLVKYLEGTVIGEHIDKILGETCVHLPVPEQPESLAPFTEELKRRAALALGPLTMHQLCLAVLQGEPWAMQRAMDFLWGRPASGPTVAQQFNFGPQPEKPKSLNFEKLIAQAEAADDRAGFGGGHETSLLELPAEDEEKDE